MGRQDCKQPRQDYIIAVEKKKKKKYKLQGGQPRGYGDAQSLRRHVARCLSQQHLGNACGSLRSYKARHLVWRRGGRCDDSDRMSLSLSSSEYFVILD